MAHIRVNFVVVRPQIVADLVYVREIHETVGVHDGVTVLLKGGRGAPHRKPDKTAWLFRDTKGKTGADVSWITIYRQRVLRWRR